MASAIDERKASAGDVPATRPTPPPPEYVVQSEHIDLDIDLLRQRIHGRAELAIQPQKDHPGDIRLNFRGAIVTAVTVNGLRAIHHHDDPFAALRVRRRDVSHHDRIRDDLGTALDEPLHPQLAIKLPKGVRLERAKIGTPDAPGKRGVLERSRTGLSLADGGEPRSATDAVTIYEPLKVVVRYEITDCKECMHFVGVDENDHRYPHAYTLNSPYPGSACALFPCVDGIDSRSFYTFTVRVPRTVGDVFAAAGKLGEDLGANLTEEERGMEMAVLGSGDLTDEIVDPADKSHKTFSFKCDMPITARHFGIAIGPFEHVDLAEYRESEQDDRLGDSAVHVHGFCLPNRSMDMRNTCLPIAMSIDHFTQKYSPFPFKTYKMCFVDDLDADVSHTAGLSICSTRLLFPEEIIDTMDDVTVSLAHGVACQWAGIMVVPKTPQDAWITAGASMYMALLFMRELWGRNEYRYRHKAMVDKVFEMDVNRQSLENLGPLLPLDPTEVEFMNTKAPLVLYILNNRIIKAMGRNGVDRILWRTFTQALSGTGPEASITTEAFRRICERVGHMNLDVFFAQWVQSSGCPKFYVGQKFNKKKLMVELTFRQNNNLSSLDQTFTADSLTRKFKEAAMGIPSTQTLSLFTGPMTVRIHEADGTPYEHIVEIKDMVHRIDIPYNTKYKRLKRSKRQKERAALNAGVDVADAQDDVLVYCLGDVLQSEEEVQDWNLVDWSREDEIKMGEESYEWVRVDKDFEWIGEIQFNQPHYMFVSQLQQDHDVVAQVESLRYLDKQQPFPIISTILVRTLMDTRYYYRIRMHAARSLVKCATDTINWIGLEHLEKAYQDLFCIPGSGMPRPNDFSQRENYAIQCEINKAISRVKDSSGKATQRVKQFLVDKLKFNENAENPFSDSFYISMLLNALTETLLVKRKKGQLSFSFEDDDEEDEAAFVKFVLGELERYRRMDEWVPSYHNIFSTTTLECLSKLVQHKVVNLKGAEFFQYTRPSNWGQVRLKAFEALVDVGLLQAPGVLSFLLYSFEAEKSPYMRRRLWHIFERGVSKVALGEFSKEPEKTATDDLIVEADSSEQTQRQNQKQRTTDVKGALTALRKELSDNESLRTALTNLLRARSLTLQEYSAVLDICNLLYEPAKGGLVVKLRYPRYWRCQHLGDGKLRFFNTPRIRTAPISKWRPVAPAVPRLSIKTHVAKPAPLPTPIPHPTPSPADSRKRRRSSIDDDEAPLMSTKAARESSAQARVPLLKLKTKSFDSPRPPATPTPATPTPATAARPPTKILKLKIPSGSLRRFREVAARAASASAPATNGPLSIPPPSAKSASPAASVGGPAPQQQQQAVNGGQPATPATAPPLKRMISFKAKFSGKPS